MQQFVLLMMKTIDGLLFVRYFPQRKNLFESFLLYLDFVRTIPLDVAKIKLKSGYTGVLISEAARALAQLHMSPNPSSNHCSKNIQAAIVFLKQPLNRTNQCCLINYYIEKRRTACAFVEQIFQSITTRIFLISIDFLRNLLIDHASYEEFVEIKLTVVDKIIG